MSDAKVWTDEEILALWPQAEGELRGFQRALQAKSGLTAGQLGMALQLAGEAFLRKETTARWVREAKESGQAVYFPFPEGDPKNEAPDVVAVTTTIDGGTDTAGVQWIQPPAVLTRAKVLLVKKAPCPKCGTEQQHLELEGFYHVAECATDGNVWYRP